MKKLIIIRGLPGSGKSTLAHTFIADQNCRHFEADQWFVRNGEYQFDVSKLYAAHTWCQKATDTALELGNTVIVSNTFTTIKELVPYFKCAARHGIVPVVITTLNDWGNVHGVTDSKLAVMRARFQHDISEMLRILARGGYNN
jgi:predicted kinase